MTNVAYEDLERLISALGRGPHAERVETERELALLGPRVLPPLLSELAFEWQAERRFRKLGEERAVGRIRCVLAVIAFAVIAGCFVNLGGEAVLLAILCCPIAVAVLAAAGSPGEFVQPGSRLDSLLSAIVVAISRWPILDAGPLNRNQRAALWCVLVSCSLSGSRHYNAHVASDILRATEQIGDAQVLSVVEHLASAAAEYEVHPLVHKAAKQALPAVYGRAGIDLENGILLRPAVGRDESLLRPARDGGLEDSDSLLRPAGPDDDHRNAA